MDDHSESTRGVDNGMRYDGEEIAGQSERQDQQFDGAEPNRSSEDNAVRDSNGHQDSASRKLFVGGIAWLTNEESFTSYFRSYGEVIDSVIISDKYTGKSRGFGFVTFADPAIADKVLGQDHTIDGKMVEVKRTVPKEEKEPKGLSSRNKIFVGGLPLSLTNDDLREYFSQYGGITDHQVVFDRTTGRSRGFGFVTFENEDGVEKVFLDGKRHELGGKQVDIKKAEPRKAGGDHSGNAESSHGGATVGYNGFDNGSEYSGLYMAYGNNNAYGAYGNFVGSYQGFYHGYGGYYYGFGYGRPVYGDAGYGAMLGCYGNSTAFGGASNGYGNNAVSFDSYLAGRYHPHHR